MLTLGPARRNHDALPADAVTVNFAVLLDGAEIGVVGFQVYADGSLYFHGGFPDPAHRGRGYGTLAFTMLVDELPARAGGRLHLMIRPDNAASLALARRFGFTEVGRRGGGVELVLDR